MPYDLTPRVGDSAHQLLFKITAATSDVANPPNPDESDYQLLRRIAAATAAGADNLATTLSYAASVELDFASAPFETVTLAGNITFTTSNLAAGRSKTIRIIGDGSSRNFTFPGGWIFVGAAAPTSLAANKTAILTMTSFGTTDANVVAAYSAQP
jgi:hypothetical protein